MNPILAEALENVKKYDSRQPRDEHGRWSDGAGGISVGHAAHVMRHEGVSDKDAAGVLAKISDGTHKTRKDVLRHIDSIHAGNSSVLSARIKPNAETETVKKEAASHSKGQKLLQKKGVSSDELKELRPAADTLQRSPAMAISLLSGDAYQRIKDMLGAQNPDFSYERRDSGGNGFEIQRELFRKGAVALHAYGDGRVVVRPSEAARRLLRRNMTPEENAQAVRVARENTGAYATLPRLPFL